MARDKTQKISDLIRDMSLPSSSSSLSLPTPRKDRFPVHADVTLLSCVLIHIKSRSNQPGLGCILRHYFLGRV